MGSFRPLRVLSRVTAKRRKLWLMAASALAPLSLGASEPALALNECGPLVGGSVTCTSAGNPYPNGISYNTANTPINLTLSSGVIVNSDNGVSAVNFTPNPPLPPATSAPIMITATGTDITGHPNSGGRGGLFVQSSGDAVIDARNTSVNVGGSGSTNNNNAIFAITYGNSAVARVFYDAGATAGLTSTGTNSTGIQANNRGNGDAIIDASGNISGSVGTPGGVTFLGLDAVAGDTTGSGIGGGRQRVCDLP
jgi:hypothetical protein